MRAFAEETLRAEAAEGPGQRGREPETGVFGATADAVGDTLQLFLNEIARYPLLTAAEEAALSRRIERGDKAAIDAMMTANLRLVVSIAKRYAGNGVPLQDLIQEGVFGLHRAALGFDWRRGLKFSTYATWWIRQACQRCVGNTSRTIRLPLHVHARLRAIHRAEQELSGTLGRQPTSEEVARRISEPVEVVERVRSAQRTMVSLDQTTVEGGDIRLVETLSDPDSERQLDAAVDDRAARIRWAVERLPEAERRVIHLRYFGPDSPTFSEVARRLQLSVGAARNLEASALARLEAMREVAAARFAA